MAARRSYATIQMKRTIGLIGTGLLGRGMARRLIYHGHAMRTYNRTRAEAVLGAKVVMTLLADPVAGLAVVEGEQGVLSAIPPDAVLIDSTGMEVRSAASNGP